MLYDLIYKSVKNFSLMPDALTLKDWIVRNNELFKLINEKAYNEEL
jgi:hypothetical protein